MLKYLINEIPSNFVYFVENVNENAGGDWGKAIFNDEDEDMDELCVSFLDDGVDGELIF